MKEGGHSGRDGDAHSETHPLRYLPKQPSGRPSTHQVPEVLAGVSSTPSLKTGGAGAWWQAVRNPGPGPREGGFLTTQQGGGPNSDVCMTEYKLLAIPAPQCPQLYNGETAWPTQRTAHSEIMEVKALCIKAFGQCGRLFLLLAMRSQRKKSRQIPSGFWCQFC